jgi:hypothetical protein
MKRRKSKGRERAEQESNGFSMLFFDDAWKLVCEFVSWDFWLCGESQGDYFVCEKWKCVERVIYIWGSWKGKGLKVKS